MKQAFDDSSPRLIDIKKASLGQLGPMSPPGPVLWRVRVAETGRVFDIPVFEKTSYHEFMNIMLVLPGVPGAPQDAMYLVGPAPYRLLTSKKYMSILHSGERGLVYLYNISSQRLPLSPIAEPTDRTNKSIDYIVSASAKTVNRARQHLLEQEVQVSSINTLLVYARASLESFHKSYFAHITDKLDTYRSEMIQFDSLIDRLADTPLHPAITMLDAQRMADKSGGSTTGSFGGGASRGSVGSDYNSPSNTSSPAGSRSNTPRGAAGDVEDLGVAPVPVLELPGVAAAAQPSEKTRQLRTTLLDCINADSWRSKRKLFESSCNEIQGRLNVLLVEYERVVASIPNPFVLQSVHLNMSLLYRVTALLRNIIKQSSPVVAPAPGVFHAGPSPMAMDGPGMSAQQTLAEIIRLGGRPTSSMRDESIISGSVDFLAVDAAVDGLLLATEPLSAANDGAPEGSSSVESDPRDIISIYVHMEKTFQQQIFDANHAGAFRGESFGGHIYVGDIVGAGGATSNMVLEEGGAENAEKKENAMVETLQRRRYRIDQMAKVMDFFKDRLSDEVFRIGRLVRDLKVSLKHIEKSENIKFLKMWASGKNEHSATLAFLQNYPDAYKAYLAEVLRIKSYNHNIKKKIEDFSLYQNEELEKRKAFWESSLRYLPPFFSEIVPSVRRPPPMLLGAAGIPGIDELFASLSAFDLPNPSAEEDEKTNEAGHGPSIEQCETVTISPGLVASDITDSTTAFESNTAAVDRSDSLRISQLELELKEKDRELEMLKLDMKASVRYENDLRNLQNLLEPFDLGMLKIYLSSRLASADTEPSDVPTVEDICSKLISELEAGERKMLGRFQAVLTKNSYLRNSGYNPRVMAGDNEHIDVELTELEQQHLDTLEFTIEQFAKVVQRQARIMKNEPS